MSDINALPREQLRLSSQLWRNTAGWELTIAGFARQASELMDCSDPARAWQSLNCPNGHEDAFQVIVPGCKLPYCPMCGHARSAEVQRQYAPVVQDALNASPDSHRLRHITLTTPYQIDHSDMNRLAATIWKKAIAALEIALGVKQRDWKKNDIGVLGGYEFGGKGLKLHIHLLVLSKWIEFTDMKAAWKQATDDICYRVYLTGVNSVEDGVREVTKYATKLTELPPQLVPHLHTILSGKRRIRAFGAFSWKLDQVEPEPLCCPVCRAELVILPLLSLRPGNNFAANDVINPANIPHISAIPPPEQQEMAFSRDFSAFFDTFETKKR